MASNLEGHDSCRDSIKRAEDHTKFLANENRMEINFKEIAKDYFKIVFPFGVFP